MKERPLVGWLSKGCALEELSHRLCVPAWGRAEGRRGVGVSWREAGPWGAGRAAGAGEGPGLEAGLGLCPAVVPGQRRPRHAPPCPASGSLLISSFSPFMVFPVAVAFINKHFGDLPLRTSAPQESRALNIYK